MTTNYPKTCTVDITVNGVTTTHTYEMVSMPFEDYEPTPTNMKDLDNLISYCINGDIEEVKKCSEIWRMSEV